MKKSGFYGLTLMAFIAAITLFAACSTGSGSSDDPAVTPSDTPETTTPATPVTPVTPATPPATGQKDDTATPTLIDITGTWKHVFLYSNNSAKASAGTMDETDTTRLTINADGTFLRFVTEEYSSAAKFNVSIDNCFAEKGTVSVAADGTVTFFVTQTYDNNSAIVTDLSNVTWKTETRESYSYAAKKGGKLFLGVFRRQGTGTGIKGTWVSVENDIGGIEKYELVIGENDAVMNYYYPQNDSWVLGDDENGTEPDTYTSYDISNGKIHFSGTDPYTYDLTYTDDFLALDSGFERI